MTIEPSSRARAAVHVLVVVACYSLLFAWLFSGVLLRGAYLAESDLYEYYLPIFLAPITTWSSFEFSGLPAFADPGDFTTYPPHYLFARVIGSWTAFVMSAFVLASAFTYAYVYRVTRSRTAAAFAGLAYGLSEAMLERIPHLGTLHCFAWLPLVVLAIDHVRDGDRPRTWVAIGAAGLACAFLSGHPQPAVYTYYATALYALTMGGPSTLLGAGRRDGARFYVSIATMFALSMLLAAHKALPLVEASTVMARQLVNYGQFAGHANAPIELLSMLFPTVLHDGREAPTYVGLATLSFAMIGVSRARTDRRAIFWIAAALFAVLIGMGDSTPVARVAYALVPLYTKFRIGARHLFLFAFGAAFLAGKGIAAVQRGEVSRRDLRICFGVFVAVLTAAAAFQAAWPGTIVYEVRRRPAITLPIWTTGVWVQLAIAAGAAATIWVLSTMRRATPVIVAAAVLLVADDLQAFPSPVTLLGIDFGTIPRAAASPSVHARRIGTALEPLHQRALALGGTQNDAVVPAAFARLWRIPIAGGYGPMLLERYSQLGSMGTNGSVRPTVLAPDDTSLDLMSVKYLLVQRDDMPGATTFDAQGMTWDARELGLPIGRSDCNLHYVRSASIPAPPGVRVSAIGLVTHLRCSEGVPQGAVAATVRSVYEDGRTEERQLHAGIETGESGLNDPEQVHRVQHRAPIDTFADPGAPGAFRAFTRIALEGSPRLTRIEIDTPDTNGWMTLDRLTLVDADGHSHPVSAPGVWLDDRERWREESHFATSRTSDRGADADAPNEQTYTVFENTRALPRSWMTSRIVALDDRDAVEAVHRGFLPDGRRFNPREVTIVAPEEGAAPGPYPQGGGTAVVQQISDGRITVRASSPGGGFMVLSEVDYPGWRATIDGNRSDVRRADVALQGVVVPPGEHTVEFALVSTTRRAGIIMSLLGLAACAALAAIDGVRRKPVASLHGA